MSLCVVKVQEGQARIDCLGSYWVLHSPGDTFINVTENILICSTAVSLYDVLKHSIRKTLPDQLESPARNKAPFTRNQRRPVPSVAEPACMK